MVAERDVGGGRDLAHLHRVVAALGAELEGDVDDPPAPVDLWGAALVGDCHLSATLGRSAGRGSGPAGA